MVPVDDSYCLRMLGVTQQLQQKGHKIVAIAPDALVQVKESSSYTLKRAGDGGQRWQWIKEDARATTKTECEEYPCLHQTQAPGEQTRIEDSTRLTILPGE
ncbi:UDP-glucuronosyltransferase 1-1 [Heterocephalus glaber]|uniref:UDP-glucuronosyltransferase 1-1 n=1 Tax=Heterocephalus glaber TaxID=10181 RepID=G5C254_HETGA|nr:UDP-glucuronosyltransferase 1-1 [Heterocephalus glaber]